MSIPTPVSDHTKPGLRNPCIGTYQAQTLWTLFRQSRDTERALFRANSLNITAEELAAITSTSGYTDTTTTVSSCPKLHRLRAFILRRPTSSTPRVVSKMHRLQDNFVRIALKISLYPVCLFVINAFITAEDLMYTIDGGVESMGDYVLYVIYYVLYGGRGIFFALVSGSPGSMYRGIERWWGWSPC